MKNSEIKEQNQNLLKRQHEFRLAADAITDTWMTFPFISAVALIGSVARPLWKEVPRFREYRRLGVKVWHECSDLDLAVWLDSFDDLNGIRRSLASTLRTMFEIGTTTSGIASHQIDTFLFQSGSQHNVGRLCHFSQCPKGKRECLTPGCGAIPFIKQVEGFAQHNELLTGAATLYQRGIGRTCLAAKLPQPEELQST